MENESSGLKRGEEKYTLLTNIREVGYKDVRIFCNAVLLSEISAGVLGPHYTIRGFGTEAAWHNFMIHLGPESFPHTLTPFEDRSVLFIGESGVPRVLFSGNTLTLADGAEFRLYAAQSSQPIDVYFQDDDICAVWEILAEKVIQYWDAPHMPHLNYQSAAGLRAILAGKLALSMVAKDS